MDFLLPKLVLLIIQGKKNLKKSPEIYRDKPYDKMSDMWSLGCILYEMCSLRPPFLAANFKELRRNVLLGAYPPIPKFYSEELFFIIRKLLQLDPAERPDCGKNIC